MHHKTRTARTFPALLRSFQKGKRQRVQHSPMDCVEKELQDFFDECRKRQFTVAQMRDICRPLTWQRHRRLAKILLAVVALLAALYTLYRWVDCVGWFASAVGRLVLIQLLPYWNWTPLYNSKCLIERESTSSLQPVTSPAGTGRHETDGGNCALCEALERIPTASNVTFSFLEFFYLERGLPVIVTDSHTPRSAAGFLAELMAAPVDFLESDPCDMATNLLLKKLFNLELALAKIASASALDKWFLQLRNCQPRAVKASRLFVTRPYYYPLHLEPFYSSWVLMSHNYAAQQLREIHLQGLVFVQQLYGYFDVRLRPKKPCDNVCPMIALRLSAGECLVFSTDLWSFSYGVETLESKSASAATVLEIDWQF